MSILLPLLDNPQVRAGLVFSPTGTLLEALGDIDAEATAASLALMVQALERVASILHLGALEKGKVSGPTSWHLASNKNALLAVSPAPGGNDPSLDKIIAGVTWDVAGDAASLMDSSIHHRARRAPGPAPKPAVEEKPASPRPDPAQLPNLVAFTNSLRDRQDDPAALHALIASSVSLSRRWLEFAHHQVAWLIARAELTEVEALRRLARVVLDALSIRDTPVDGVLKELYLEKLPLIQRALQQLQMADTAGVAALEQATERLPVDSPLRWAAATWLADCAVAEGRGEEACKTLEEQLKGAQGRDARAEGVLRLALAQALASMARMDAALIETRSARRASASAEDAESLARAWLFEARLLASSPSSPESERCAQQARDALPGWLGPRVFLARQAVRDNKLWKAQTLLREGLPEGAPLTPALAWEAQLLERIRTGSIPPLIAAEYFRLDEVVASDEALEKLLQLDAAVPDVPHFKLAIVWKLLALGRRADARAMFERLVALEPNVLATGLVPRCFQLAAASQRVAAAPEPRRSARAVGPATAEHATAQASAASPTSAGEPAASPPRSATQLAAVGKDSAFSGELQLFALPDLLEFLRVGRRSGALIIKGPAGSGAIYLRDGMMLSASAPSSGDLGAILVETGKATSAQIERAKRTRLRDSQRRLGAILLEDEQVAATDLRDATSAQVYRAMRELVNWTTGRFAFESEREDPVLPAGLAVPLDPQGVLLDVFRVMDEESRDMDMDAFIDEQ